MDESIASGVEGGRRVLVTGGSGFIGRYIVERLLREGVVPVTYDRDPVRPRPGVVAVHGELHDVPCLVRALEEHGVREIIHTAGISDPDISLGMPVATFFANAMGTVNVLEAARLTGINRVVNFSSSSVYGHKPEGVTEDIKLEPITPYGVSKVAAELLGKVYTDLYQVETVALRVTWVYGPGNKVPETTHKMLRAAIDGTPFRMENGADHPMPMVYVEDVAEATWLALNSTTISQPAYTITGLDRPTLGEVAELVMRHVPGSDVQVGEGKLHLHELGPIDRGAAERDFGYVPGRGMDSGIGEYASWLREHEF